jgi:glucokinase
VHDVLLADIGATRARFAVLSQARIEHLRIFACADFSGPAAAARAYLTQLGAQKDLREAAFALAAPIDGETLVMVNLPWRIEPRSLQSELNLDRLTIVNDLAAVALSLSRLDARNLHQIGGSNAPDESAARAVIGIGTGLGVAAAIRIGTRWRAVASEAGHATLAAEDDEQAQLVALLRQQLGHVSAEQALSGPGLVNLYRATAKSRAASPEPLTPEAIVALARAKECALCTSAVETFAQWLGSVAGNVVLTFDAWGGVYLAGGLVNEIREWLETHEFRIRFAAKGRFQARLDRVPVLLIAHPTPALVGLQVLLEEGRAVGQPALIVDGAKRPARSRLRRQPAR